MMHLCKIDVFGASCLINLKNCQPNYIRTPALIQNYIDEIINFIDMEKHGDSQIIRFGDDPKLCGYSFLQLITTSLISGHLAEIDNSAYIDIFSCKNFNAKSAANFTKVFFRAEKMSYKIYKRY